MRRLSYRYQRTIARPAEVWGIGYLTGATVRLRFLPAPPSSGIVFVRTDLRPRHHLPANIENVTGTQRRTTLGHPPAQVGLVEHVLAALAGLRIDNCQIELNAPEPPGMDGSARDFVTALLDAGIRRQGVRRPILGVEQSVVLTARGSTLALHPPLTGFYSTDVLRDTGTDHELYLSYFLDYGLNSPIARQVHTQVITPSAFAQELASCRTFILESESAELRRQGIGSRNTPADLLVFGPHGPVDNVLRYANEPARHKVLDLVGDLSLLGVDVCGHIVAYRSGHPLNVELVRCLHRQLLGGSCTRERQAA
ncbi:MAG TPA: UDP-3-O-acyl-N-acetylglucosamine deacetylase [Gemmataceae bacterium]|nr:UDP-3-O-acyl-N-acetylglucosamine deacetylase [Gemmataceae bacterium]